MESHGIGTDATVAEHIQKQVERRYASKSEDLTFWPTPLGEGLVSGYQKMGLQGLWLPNLRQIIPYHPFSPIPTAYLLRDHHPLFSSDHWRHAED